MTASHQIGDPVFVPKGPRDLARLAGRCLAAFEPDVFVAVEEFVLWPGAESFLRFEEDVLRLFMLAASRVAAGAVAFLHDDPAWVAAAVERARERRAAPLRHQGRRSTTVRFLGGANLHFETPYVSENHDYHGVEHLTHLAEHCASWSEEVRSKWVRRMRRRLKRGHVDAILKEARTLVRGRNAGKILTEVNYFESRRAMMRYDEFRRRGIPQGSGAVESAIRRVVNLCLKGPSISWRGPNAE